MNRTHLTPSIDLKNKSDVNDVADGLLGSLCKNLSDIHANDQFESDDNEIKIAVLDFTVLNEDSETGDAFINFRHRLTESMVKKIIEIECGFSVVSPKIVDGLEKSVTLQNRYELSNLFNEDERISLGRYLNANILVTGVIKEIVNEAYYISAVAIDVKSATLMGAYTNYISSDMIDQLSNLLKYIPPDSAILFLDESVGTKEFKKNEVDRIMEYQMQIMADYVRINNGYGLNILTPILL